MVARWLLALLLLFPTAWWVRAQGPPSIRFSLDPARVRVGEPATLSLEVRGQGTIRVPDPDLGGAGSSRRTSTRVSQVQGLGGGATVMAVTWRLVPSRSGTFRVGPLELEVGGRPWPTPALELRVSPPPSPTPAISPEALPDPGGDPLVVTAGVDRDQAYVGQPIRWTFRLYQAVALSRAPEFEPPACPGFLVVEGPRRELYTTLQGRRYGVAEVPLFLFPQTTGSQVIGPAAVKLHRAAFNPFDHGESRGFLERLFSGPRPGMLATPAIPVTILPLPREGRPPGFTGGVGRFQLRAGLSAAEVAVGQPVTLELQVQGEGNLHLLDPPLLPALPAFKVYRTTSSGGLAPDSDRPQGVRVFRTVLVPQRPGELSLAGIRLVHFDPELARWEVREAPPLSLKVAPGGASAGVPHPGASPGAGPAAEPSVALEAAPPARVGPSWTLPPPRGWGRWATLGPLLMGLAWVWLARLRGREQPERAAWRALAALADLEGSGLNAGGLEAALRGYLEQRLPRWSGAWTRAEGLAQVEAELGPRRRAELEGWWVDLDREGYSPARSQGGLEGLRIRAREWVERCGDRS